VVSASPGERCDLAVVGGGILGLALAHELLARRPDLRVELFEREADVALHQTGNNSGVLHAGIYYKPGSLKAQLCVDGVRRMYAFCEQHGIAHERCGKVIVATRRAELPALDELERRGRANGVPDLRRLDARGLEQIEPHARGVAALHSPHSGIADFAAVARALAEDVLEAGGTVHTGCAVRALRHGHGGVTVEHARGELHARSAIACAGAWADRLAVAAGAPADPRIVPFRGAYLRLRPERRHLVRGLIYPVPDPALPFLGVHLTRHVSGGVLIGPTALLAPARDAYSLRTVRRRDLVEALGWPGTWRMARRFWRTGLTELAFATSRRALVKAAARFVPELRATDVLPGPAGVRAQALGRDGRLVDDFAFSRTGATLHVRNAPSPAATSSLAIAREIADQAEAALGLAR
jgi:2-hydroxyglutarate dehydrogenase